MNKAVFLDRDGTINVEKHYLHKIEEFEFLPGVIEGLRLLQDAGFLLIVVTNQSGIARGYYTEEDFQRLNSWMLETLAAEGIQITHTYYCPHHPDALLEQYRMRCSCRKPELGMYEQAVQDYGIDYRGSFAIGDKIRDCAICAKSDVKGFLIGENEKDDIISDVKAGRYKNVRYAENLLESVKKIVQQTEM